MADLREDRTWTIGDLAKAFGVTARALRFYEDKGLLSPQRDMLNRVYSARDRARLQLILRGKRVGFSLSEIRDMLDLYDLGDGQRAQMQRSLEMFERKRVELARQREDLDEAIAELERGIGWVRERLAHDPAIGAAKAYEAVARRQLDGLVTDAGLHETT
jgi:DNA-binding transcriptional MerR regulator